MPNKQAIELAKAWYERKPIFLDTETTSFQGQAVDIGIIDIDGNVLLNTLVKPKFAMDEGARAVHHITDEMLADAPSFEDVWNDKLKSILDKRLVLIYNAAFDSSILVRSARNADNSPILPMEEEVYQMLYCLPSSLYEYGVRCLMNLFSDFIGSAKWKKLDYAAEYFGLLEQAQEHRALSDAEMARKVFLAMVNYGNPKQISESAWQMPDGSIVSIQPSSVKETTKYWWDK